MKSSKCCLNHTFLPYTNHAHAKNTMETTCMCNTTSQHDELSKYKTMKSKLMQPNELS